MPVADNSSLMIKSLHRDYEVTFAEGIETLAQTISRYNSKVLVLDEEVARIYASALEPLITELPVYIVPATEATKTLDGVQDLIDWLLERKCNRSTTIIGIGGGIIQDLVTFTSNIFYRGTDFVLVPTTLLSMSDSCIGAKCGINYGNFKNQLGVIYAPKAVHVITDFLDTLDEREIKSGYGEILKLAITGSKADLEHLISTVSISGLRGSHVIQLVRRSLEIKKVVIEEDEYEADLRRILNYGHTFGHALEALTNHAIPHGLAVAWGIDVINYLAAYDDQDLQDLFETTHQFITNHLSFELGEFPDASELVEMTRRDKKMANGLLNLAIPTSDGKLVIVPTHLNNELVLKIASYLRSNNVYAKHS